jgi:hypothetical protein
VSRKATSGPGRLDPWGEPIPPMSPGPKPLFCPNFVAYVGGLMRGQVAPSCPAWPLAHPLGAISCKNSDTKDQPQAHSNLLKTLGLDIEASVGISYTLCPSCSARHLINYCELNVASVGPRVACFLVRRFWPEHYVGAMPCSKRNCYFWWVRLRSLRLAPAGQGRQWPGVNTKKTRTLQNSESLR